MAIWEIFLFLFGLLVLALVFLLIIEWLDVTIMTMYKNIEERRKK